MTLVFTDGCFDLTVRYIWCERVNAALATGTQS
jgi:hypothetical protein